MYCVSTIFRTGSHSLGVGLNASWLPVMMIDVWKEGVGCNIDGNQKHQIQLQNSNTVIMYNYNTQSVTITITWLPKN